MRYVCHLATLALWAAPAPFDANVKPFVKTYCAGCHSGAAAAGGLKMAPGPQDRETWEKMIDKVRGGEMPPPGVRKPPAAEAAAFIASVEKYYAQQDRRTPPDPGRLTAHRLNRYEYNRTVQDLLGVKLRAADEFPVDPFGYGFDNIGDALTLSPLLTEKYLKAAERLARAALPSGQPEKVIAARYMAEALGQRNQLHIQTLHDFPVDGEYTLRTAWFQGMPAGFAMRGRLYLDRQLVLDQPIRIYTEMDRGIEAQHIRIAQGPHLIEAEIEIPATHKGAKPYPEYIQVHGPFAQAKPEETESYRRIFPCGHAVGQHSPTCIRRTLSTLARRAYRRPVEKQEVESLIALADFARSRGATTEEAVRVAIEAILMSPHFLFRTEHDPAGPQPRRVTELELASRLSYFLWSSMPDDELLSLAEKGRLRANLPAQVRRMMADARSQALAENFSAQWLQTRNLEALKPDPKKFPEFDSELRDAMRQETERFFAALVQEDRSILDLLDAPFTYLNERLAKFYGIPGVTGREFRRHSLAGTDRSGVLTHASVLAVSSYPTRTSPVIRGKWVLENLLNKPPPPPPPDVPQLDEKKLSTAASFRQQLEQHRQSPQCAGCHARMDPIGFGLENYDAIGRWRTSENGLPLDTSGVLPNGKSFQNATELKAILKADAPRFARALSEKLLTYALGRGLEPYDRPAVLRIAQRVEQNGYRFSELIAAVIESVPFQMRRAQRSAP